MCWNGVIRGRAWGARVLQTLWAGEKRMGGGVKWRGMLVHQEQNGQICCRMWAVDGFFHRKERDDYYLPECMDVRGGL